MRKRILIMTEWFYPGYKAGGPIRACYNLAMLLSADCDVFVYTRDRDLTGARYPCVPVDQWTHFSPGVQVFYASPARLGWHDTLGLLRDARVDAIYLNSMYSVYFTIYPLLMKRWGKLDSRVILSPRGMLRNSALQFKYFKKKTFLSLLKLFRISDRIGFHATDEQERQDIRKIFGRRPTVELIGDVPPEPAGELLPLAKQPGELKLVFVGRIHPIKNLHVLLGWLSRISVPLSLTVVGPVEDKDYFSHCLGQASRLPRHVSIDFAGEVNNEEVKRLLERHHFMILPTAGENYGYAIVESFCAGRPVIITDATPWHNLSAQKIGWDLPLAEEEKFLLAIHRAASMSTEEFHEWSAASLHFSRRLFAAATTGRNTQKCSAAEAGLLVLESRRNRPEKKFYARKQEML